MSERIDWFMLQGPFHVSTINYSPCHYEVMDVNYFQLARCKSERAANVICLAVNALWRQTHPESEANDDRDEMKLKACPFCGGEAELCETIGQSENVDDPRDDVPESIYLVQCKSGTCAYNTWLLSERDALTAWNTRHDDAVVEKAKAVGKWAQQVIDTLRDCSRPMDLIAEKPIAIARLEECLTALRDAIAEREKGDGR